MALCTTVAAVLWLRPVGRRFLRPYSRQFVCQPKVVFMGRLAEPRSHPSLAMFFCKYRLRRPPLKIKRYGVKVGTTVS